MRRKVKKIFWKTPYFELIFLIMHRKIRKNYLKSPQKIVSKLSTAPRRGLLGVGGFEAGGVFGGEEGVGLDGEFGVAVAVGGGEDLGGAV